MDYFIVFLAEICFNLLESHENIKQEKNKIFDFLVLIDKNFYLSYEKAFIQTIRGFTEAMNIKKIIRYHFSSHFCYPEKFYSFSVEYDPQKLEIDDFFMFLKIFYQSLENFNNCYYDIIEGDEYNLLKKLYDSIK
ncbi:MAG: hypothetical protein NZZ41_00825 [Candidatus Dojkabacteria bacterium]|nr:hypothetical protein [Candidatus Dojkabacteria bacterium]